MQDVLTSGRVSDTPYAPVTLTAREDLPGHWEIADGHHRVAAAIRDGYTVIVADLDSCPDEEPYEPSVLRLPPTHPEHLTMRVVHCRLCAWRHIAETMTETDRQWMKHYMSMHYVAPTEEQDRSPRPVHGAASCTPLTTSR